MFAYNEQVIDCNHRGEKFSKEDDYDYDYDDDVNNNNNNSNNIHMYMKD